MNSVAFIGAGARGGGFNGFLGNGSASNNNNNSNNLAKLTKRALRRTGQNKVRRDQDEADSLVMSSVAGIPVIPVKQNEKVAVLGATGGVGYFVMKALIERQRKQTEHQLQLIALVRNVQKAKEIFGDAANQANVEFRSIDVINQSEEEIGKTVKDINSLVICTGTTAFPSSAWKNNNTPENVDYKGVAKIASALPKDSIRRVVQLSSVGVLRKSSFPFSILNLFGVLDAKKKGEDAIVQASKDKKFEYAIVRLGRLVGAPFTNVGAIKKNADQNKQAVQIKNGDSLAGDLARSSAGDVAVQALFQPSAANKQFAAVNIRGTVAKDDSEWDQLFETLERPNAVLRLEYNSINLPKFRKWLISWAGAVLTSGALFPPLPLPVRFDYTELGCMLTFLTVNDGKVNAIGSLNIMIEEATETRKAALVVYREPMFQDKPYPGEKQILAKLQEDVMNVSYTPEA
mmetsp:Transcript_7133/g.12821  ORF Transcript_7133/g.12821 Transcript_7133/m.12821 type:complete len:459 (-) Transcript_7133:89-1465(-)